MPLTRIFIIDQLLGHFAVGSGQKTVLSLIIQIEKALPCITFLMLTHLTVILGIFWLNLGSGYGEKTVLGSPNMVFQL